MGSWNVILPENITIRKVISEAKQVTLLHMRLKKDKTIIFKPDVLLISPRSLSYVRMVVWCSAVIAVSFCTHHPLSPMGTLTPRFVFSVIIHMQTAWLFLFDWWIICSWLRMMNFAHVSVLHFQASVALLPESALQQCPSKVQHQYSNNMSSLDVHCLAQLQTKPSPPSLNLHMAFTPAEAAQAIKMESKPESISESHLKVMVKLKPHSQSHMEDKPWHHGKRWKGLRWRKWTVHITIPRVATQTSESEVEELLQQLNSTLRPCSTTRDRRRCCFLPTDRRWDDGRPCQAAQLGLGLLGAPQLRPLVLWGLWDTSRRPDQCGIGAPARANGGLCVLSALRRHQWLSSTALPQHLPLHLRPAGRLYVFQG